MSPVCLVSVDQRPYERLGPLSFFAPGVPTVNKGIFATGVTCIFNAPFMNHLVEIERDLHFGKIDALAAIDSHRLTYLGQEMLREALSPGFGGALRAQAMGMEAVLEITRCDGALRSEEPAARSGLAPWQMRRLDAYVREHLANDVTLTDLADLLGMSVRHLSRVVKHAKGRSVHCWVADLRMAEAQRLLTETKLPLHEIAQRVAFRGAGAFSTAFRAASGFTPSDYRRLARAIQ